LTVNIKLYGVYLAKVGFLESGGFKIRPIIVISKPRGRFHAVMAIPISTQIDRTDVDILLGDLAGTGLLKPSIARVHRLSAIAGTQVLEEIGSIDKKHQEVIKSALKELFKL
jgi:mRNA-degrading endonuclease toxin of MazEF toxin-antitoxin module